MKPRTSLCSLGLFLLAVPLFAQVPNDALDDTAWVQSRLDDLSKPSTTDRTPFAAGKFIVTEELKLGPTMGLKLRGAGGQNRSASAGWDAFRNTTIFEWRGEAGGTILKTAGCTGLVIEGIAFESKDANKRAGIGMLISHGRTGALNIVFRDCGFQNLGAGIQCGTAWGESTCANVTYDNCHFEQCSEACVRLVNAQSLEHLFLRPQFAWSPVAIDVQGGGDVSVVGGGSYEVGSLLHLNRIGGNARGFDFNSLRCDGKNQRTAFLTVEDTDEGRGYGTITFRNMTQNNGQQGDTSRPLVTVPPGARVVLSSCGFAGSFANWAAVYSDRRYAGELYVEYCDGLSPGTLETLVEAKGARAYWAFRDVGNLVSPTRSVSNFPPDAVDDDEPQPVQFTPEEAEVLRALLSRKQCLLEAADGMKRIKAGDLTVTLPETEQE